MPNPGFEDSTTKIADYWSPRRYAPSGSSISASLYRDTNDAASGAASGRIDVTSLTGSANAKWLQINTLTLQAGVTYRIKCTYKTAESWTLRVYLSDSKWKTLGDNVDPFGSIFDQGDIVR